MSKLFAYDNPIWRVMGRVADIFILTVLWILFSLPIITIGASTIALYYVTLKMAENKEGYLAKAFVKAFRDNLAEGVLLEVIMVILGGAVAYGIFSFRGMATELDKIMLWFFGVIGVVYLFMLTAVFPLAARLDAPIPKLLALTYMVCIQKFSWIMFMAVMTACVIAFSVFVFWPILLFSMGLIAWIHSYVMVKAVFPKYHWNSEE